MKPYAKLRVMIADDRRSDQAAAQSALLAKTADEELSSGMMAGLALEHLDICCFATAASAIQFIKNGGAPDFSVIDLDFSETRSETQNQDEIHEEGLSIIAALRETAPEAPFVCFSNFVASFSHRLVETAVLEHALGKSNREALTRKAVTSLRDAAARRLKNLEAAEKSRLLNALETMPPDALSNLEITSENQIFLARQLLIGWAEVCWNDDADAAGLRFPDPINLIIKTLLQTL